MGEGLEDITAEDIRFSRHDLIPGTPPTPHEVTRYSKRRNHQLPTRQNPPGTGICLAVVSASNCPQHYSRSGRGLWGRWKRGFVVPEGNWIVTRSIGLDTKNTVRPASDGDSVHLGSSASVNLQEYRSPSSYSSTYVLTSVSSSV